MAAEYEVNIKINTQEIERELKKVDKAVNNIGKGKGGQNARLVMLSYPDSVSEARQNRLSLWRCPLAIG